MIKPVFRKVDPFKNDDDRETIEYWLSKTTDERMDAMGELHRQVLITAGYTEIPHIKRIVNKLTNETSF